MNQIAYYLKIPWKRAQKWNFEKKLIFQKLKPGVKLCSSECWLLLWLQFELMEYSGINLKSKIIFRPLVFTVEMRQIAYYLKMPWKRAQKWNFDKKLIFQKLKPGFKLCSNEYLLLLWLRFELIEYSGIDFEVKNNF